MSRVQSTQQKHFYNFNEMMTFFDIHIELHNISPSPSETSKTSAQKISKTLISSYPSPPTVMSPADMVHHHNICLSTSLTTLAPLQTCTISFTHFTPWFISALCQLKALNRRLEWLNRKTGLTVHRDVHKEMNSDHYIITTRPPLPLPNPHITHISSTPALVTT